MLSVVLQQVALAYGWCYLMECFMFLIISTLSICQITLVDCIQNNNVKCCGTLVWAVFISFFVSLAGSDCVSVSVSLSHTHTHTRYGTCDVWNTRTHKQTDTKTDKYRQSHSHTHTHTHRHTTTHRNTNTHRQVETFIHLYIWALVPQKRCL